MARHRFDSVPPALKTQNSLSIWDLQPGSKGASLKTSSLIASNLHIVAMPQPTNPATCHTLNGPTRYSSINGTSDGASVVVSTYKSDILIRHVNYSGLCY